jgi:hypothetical protein
MQAAPGRPSFPQPFGSTPHPVAVHPHADRPPSPDITCAVCLDTAHGGGDTDTLRVPCRHNFHTTCLVQWVCASTTSRCPLCRQDMFTPSDASSWALSSVLAADDRTRHATSG